MKIGFLKLKRMVLAGVALLTSFSANAFPINFSAIGEKYPDVTIPFSLAKKGVVFTADLDAGVKTYTYTFYLDFSIKDDEQELQRIATLLGAKDPDDGATTNDSNGQFVYFRTGVDIPLRLTISRVDTTGEMLVYDKSFQRLWSLGGNNSSASKAIDFVKLDPAHYKVRLETLAAVSELADVPIDFRIGLPGKH